MKTSHRFGPTWLSACAAFALAGAAQAQVFDVTIDGSDAIWLAGRTDLAIPAANLTWSGGLLRHPGPTPEEILETMPSFISVVTGDVVKALDPALGGISFFNGFGAPLFGPGGNGATGSSLTLFGGISGYIGPQGPLVGVFLSAAIPAAGPPAGLDFSPSGLGIDFLTLSPDLGQIFYIGDGKNASDQFQSFIAPTGATRLFLGIPDGFGFGGAPGAYDDNDGSYRVRIGVNQVPSIPEPETYALMLGGLALLRLATRRRRA
ncbi:MAG: PEP-CTERM sorting domain-containing protein [Caldimonas sp.]